MRVEVRFYGFVHDVIDTAYVALEMPSRSTLRDLLNLLVKRSGETLSKRLFTITGELETNVRVFVGNNQTPSLEQPLGDGQRAPAEVKVFVLSATAGG